MDIAEIRKLKRANTRTVSILLEPDLRLEHDRLDARWRRARGDEADRLREELDDLEERIEAVTASFTFKALSRRRWQELVDEHPPSDDDREVGLGFNLETLGPIVLVEGSVDPVLELSDVEDILDSPEWGDAEVNALVVAAVAVNRELRNVPKGSN